MSTITKALIGKEDLKLKESGTTEQTYTRTDSESRTLTLKQIDAAHIQFRTLAKQIDDLVDGGYDVPIKPSKIFGGANNTSGHTVPDVADDTFTMIAAAQTLTNKTLTTPTVNGGTVSGVTLTGSVTNSGTISGGTIDGSAISNGTISAASISGGTIDTAAISNGTISAATISGGTINTAAISNGTISAASISGGTIVSCAADTISESAAGSGVTIDGCIIKDGGVEAVTDAGGGANLKPKIVNIGIWNMDTTTSVAVLHGVDLTKIRDVSVLIISDLGARSHLNIGVNAADTTPQGFISDIDASYVNLYRLTGGKYDGITFDDAINRGYIVLWLTE